MNKRDQSYIYECGLKNNSEPQYEKNHGDITASNYGEIRAWSLSSHMERMGKMVNWQPKYKA